MDGTDTVKISITIDHVPSGVVWRGVWENTNIGNSDSEEIEKFTERILKIISGHFSDGEPFTIFDGSRWIIIPPEILKSSIINVFMDTE